MLRKSTVFRDQPSTAEAKAVRLAKVVSKSDQRYLELPLRREYGRLMVLGSSHHNIGQTIVPGKDDACLPVIHTHLRPFDVFQ